MIYTAEELLKKDPIKGSLAREISLIEKKYEEQQLKNIMNDGNQHTEQMVNDLKKINYIEIKQGKDKYIVRYKKKTICWLRSRKHGFSITTSIPRKTIKVKSEDDYNKGLELIKEMIS